MEQHRERSDSVPASARRSLPALAVRTSRNDSDALGRQHACGGSVVFAKAGSGRILPHGGADPCDVCI